MLNGRMYRWQIKARTWIRLEKLCAFFLPGQKWPTQSWIWKLHESYSLAFAVSRSQPRWAPAERNLSNKIINTSNEGMFYSSRMIQRLAQSVPHNIQAARAVHVCFSRKQDVPWTLACGQDTVFRQICIQVFPYVSNYVFFILKEFGFLTFRTYLMWCRGYSQSKA